VLLRRFSLHPRAGVTPQHVPAIAAFFTGWHFPYQHRLLNQLLSADLASR